jgi:Tyrosine phosphatase family
MTASNSKFQDEVIQNFRQVVGLPKICRSAAPDLAAESLNLYLQNIDLPLSEAERFLFFEADLWVDLRVPEREVDHGPCACIMENAPGGAFVPFSLDSSESPEPFMATMSMTKSGESIADDGVSRKKRHRVYMHCDQDHYSESFENFFSDDMEILNSMEAATSQHEKMGIIMKELEKNHGGLVGMFAVILRTRSVVIGVLKGITVHLEQQRDGRVLVHCSAGKDRTGIIIMLCQSIVGIQDEDIIEEFAKSGAYKELAVKKLARAFKGVDMSAFAGAEPEVMKATLELIRKDHGSVEGYLDSIGFDKAWRERFVAAVSN